MGLIDLRDLVAFPGNGDNSTDTVINGVHFNTTNLNYWNYTLYSNGTLSNNSRCYLVFKQYMPTLLTNGTWVNGTTCYVPIQGIGERGKVGIAFAVIFGISIMFTLLNLKKHGQQFLREEKRFRIIGRRWQWYWMLAIAGCAMISTITGVDVDRNYLQQLPIILQCLFFYLMLPMTMACVWEATRHWGSWSERQIHDVNPFEQHHNDRRSSAEFYMPLIFYFFAFFNFFMTVPRSWTKIQYQRSPAQQTALAEPAATDGRFKAAGFLGALAYLTIIYNLNHNLHYYFPKPIGIFNKLTHIPRHAPLKLVLAIAVLSISTAYAIASSFIWSISLMKFNGDPAWPYALGYAPPAAILVIFNIWGYIDENEDKQLIQQRRLRGAAADAELGYVKKPSWWHKFRGDSHLTHEERMFSEVGTGRKKTTTTTGQRGTRDTLELRDDINRQSYIQDSTVKYSDFPNPRVDRAGARTSSARHGELSPTSLRDRSRSRGTANDPFRDPSPAYSSEGEVPLAHAGLRPGIGREASGVSSTAGGSDTASVMTGTTAGTGQQQRIRSMLDV